MASEPTEPCCVEGHLRWEEENILHMLPEKERRQILEEHAALRRLGYPPFLVEQHGARELDLMRKHCPEGICKTIENDHKCLGRMQCDQPHLAG